MSHLRNAVAALSRRLRLLRSSSVYETEPQEFEQQPCFLNAVLLADTDSSAQAVVGLLLATERELGRHREHVPAKGPRVIDLDLLLLGDKLEQAEDVSVPHPRMLQRLFVLTPLAEIDPDLIHPVEGRSIRGFRDELSVREQSGAVRLFAPPLF
ncbi:MAG: 2-amino-4-hydroxy-6-hydroxymethyldihydropteridine diphosphokinase [Acidobacteriales bacterium]|nr:2-amino-4-hydroxy-6-hydroxymethyldihydropteridine diphosphokinase [Terriglobales bacterium]